MKFAVSIISPPDYLPSATFREVARTVHDGLIAIGHDSILTTRTDLPDRRHIIFGANLLSRYPQSLKPDSIIYNLEQVEAGSVWFDQNLLDLFQRHTVWDYSRSNVATLNAMNIAAIYVPIGYMPCLSRIATAASKDIDILFFGSLNDRRNRILTELIALGHRVEVVSGIYGDHRDGLIARSKIVLNVHYYESKIFEIVRVSYLLANRVFVVSESGDDRSEDFFERGLVFSNYENLVRVCERSLAQSERYRRGVAEVGFALMALRDEETILREAIAATPAPLASDPQTPDPWSNPRLKVNVGSGGRPMLGYINTDVIKHPNVDRVCPSWALDIPDSSVEELRSHDVIEHLFPKDWPPTLKEFWRVLRPGGTIILSVPDFGEVARGYTEGRYSIDDARTFVMATVPPFNSVNYDVPESYHRTVHSKASLTADLAARGFVNIKTWTETYPWNLFVSAQKPAANVVAMSNEAGTRPAVPEPLIFDRTSRESAARRESASSKSFGSWTEDGTEDGKWICRCLSGFTHEPSQDYCFPCGYHRPYPVVKICGMMRVKNEARWIADAVASMLRVCDGGVYILDDHSTDDTVAICKTAGAHVIESPFTKLNETRDKNFLLNIVKVEAAPDWVLCIDGDEVLETSAPERILWSIQSGVADTYWLQALYIWDRMDQVRVDGVYREFVRPSLFNAKKGDGRFVPTANGRGTSANLHCMNVPMDISNSRGPCAARFRHYGYFDREMRLKKYEFYNRIDPNNEIEDCYRHVVQGDIPEVPGDATLRHAGPIKLVPYTEE